MQKPFDHPDQLQRRRGFSLVELLIVLAVLSAIASLILPSMRGPLDKSRLTSAARQVQSSLAKARSLAIREGTDVAFRYEISGDHYRIERWSAQVDSTITVLEEATAATSCPSGLTLESPESATGAASASAENQSTSTILREGQLPTGVTFEGSVVPFSGAVEHKTEFDSTQATSVVFNERRWSEPIRFRPSGRTENQTIRLVGQREFFVDVKLRGVTSMASYSSPTRDTPNSVGTSSQGATEALP